MADDLWGELEKLPPAPVNVKLKLRNGQEIPIDLVYAGYNHERDVHEFKNTEPLRLALTMDDVEGISCDRLPDHTAIELDFEP